MIVNGINDGDADAGPPPVNEGVEHAIDNLGQKYLNFLDLGSGLAVQPGIGWTVVTGLRLYTANDEEARDPASFSLEGSIIGLSGPWVSIAGGVFELPPDRNPGGAIPLGEHHHTVSFANATPYLAYRLTFPALRNAAAANSMQIGEIELLGVPQRPVPPPNGPGYALRFNGQGEFVEATLATPPTGDSHYTIEAWIKTTAMNDGTIAAWGNFGTPNQVNGFRLTANGLVNYWWGNDLSVTTPNLAGAWHHVAATFDGRTRRIFVDGVLMGRDFPTGHDANAGNFHIGAAGGFFTTEFFSGEIDEVRLWNIGRSGSEIQADMRRQLFGTEPGLVAYWRFDEGTGVSAFDATGNADNTATRVGHLPWVLSTIAPFAPTVRTLPPAGTMLWGSVDGSSSIAPFEAYFEWGPTPRLGNELRAGVIIDPGSPNRVFGLPISGLAENATYYFRAVAASGQGASYGETSTFLFDTNAPLCVDARATPTFRNVIVGFSERLDSTRASDRFNYAVAGFEVTRAALDATGTNVILSLDQPMTPGATYTVTVQDVTDLAGNTQRDNPCQLEFRGFEFVPGWLVFEAYHGTPGPTSNGLIPGTSVLSLTSHPSFPHSPSETQYLPTFDTRAVYPDDTHELYGASIRGVFVPPTSGNWIFYLRSDDASQLFLDATGPLGENASLIAEETECCRPFSAHPSGPVPLTAGQNYFIQVLYKEGGGGDYAQVAAKLETDPTHPDSLLPIPGPYLAAPADCVLPPVPSGPNDTVATAGSPATFEVMVAGSPPFRFQWMRNDISIPGATNRSYTLPSPSEMDNGARFSVAITNACGVAISRQATLTVPPDSNVADCSSRGESGAVYITYRMPVVLDGNYTVAFSNLFVGDFNLGNGGFTVETPRPYAGSWQHNAAKGSWEERSQGPNNDQANTSMLTSPVINLTSAGTVRLAFTHRYSFEQGFWDGGQVRVSVNDGPFDAVPANSFLANGYTGTVLGNSGSELRGQSAFVEESPGYGLPLPDGRITSICVLGTFQSGDTLRVQFIAASDANTRWGDPAWEIDGLEVTAPDLQRLVVTGVGYGEASNIVRLSLSPSLLSVRSPYFVTIQDVHRQDGFLIEPNPTRCMFTHVASGVEIHRLPGGSVQLAWEGYGQLQSTDELRGHGQPTVWTDVAGATFGPVTVLPEKAKRFFRVRR